mgnify:FL=1
MAPLPTQWDPKQAALGNNTQAALGNNAQSSESWISRLLHANNAPPSSDESWLSKLLHSNPSKNMASGPASADYQTGYLKDMLGRGAPVQDQTQSNQAREQQNQLADLLRRQASGLTPGAGEMAVNRQIGQAQAAQTAQASMARGANAALAGRTAARNTADIGVVGAGSAAQAQMQDQTNAQGQLGSLLGNMRGQDIGVAQGNQQAQLQQQQAQLAALAQMLNVDEATLRQDLAKRGLKLQGDANDNAMLGTMLQLAATAAATVVAGPAGGAAAYTATGAMK